MKSVPPRGSGWVVLISRQLIILDARYPQLQAYESITHPLPRGGTDDLMTPECICGFFNQFRLRYYL